jgi:hypothetical protein
MSGILSDDKAVFVAIAESTYGTDAVDAAIDANTDLNYLAVLTGSALTPSPDFFRPNQVRASQDGIAHTFVARGGGVALNFPLRGGVGTPNTPNYAAILDCMGLDYVAGASSTVCTIKTRNDSSITLYKYQRNISNDNWRLQRGLGIRLTASFEGAMNQEATGTATGRCINNPEWTVDRAYFNSSDEPALDFGGNAVTYTGAGTADTAERMICKSMTLTVGGTSYPCSAFNFDLGFTIADLDALTGAAPAMPIRSRGDGANVTGNLSLEMVDASAYGTALDDALTKYQASTEAALVIVISGSTRKLTINMPKIQFTRPTERPNNGAMGWDLGFTANGDFASAPFGDNSVVFTYADV